MFKGKRWTKSDSLSEVEIPNDPTLPQLATLLDEEYMGQLFQEKLFAGFDKEQFKIERCGIAHLHYRPLYKCHIYYNLDIREYANNQHANQFISIKINVKERYPERVVAKRRKQMNIAPVYGQSFAYFAKFKMMLISFPNDLKISNLYQIVFPAELQKIIGPTLNQYLANTDETENTACPIQIISYKPERSCLVKCVVQPLSTGTARDMKKVIYGRIYSNRRGEQIYPAMEAIWNGQPRRTGLLSVAEPLAYDPTSRILFQGCVEGVPLKNLIDRKEFVSYVGATARSLVAIHQTKVKLNRTITPNEAYMNLKSRAQSLMAVVPETKTKVERILDWLKRTMPCNPTDDLYLIHGDFSMSQVLVGTNQQISIIDFDDVCMGNPNTDICRFLSHLEYSVLADSKHTLLKRQSVEEFCSQYEKAMPGVLVPKELSWYKVVDLVQRAGRSLKFIKPGWAYRIDNYLNEAETLICKK